MTQQHQLEMVFNAGMMHMYQRKVQPRRAKWWFTQMRAAVMRAVQWTPPPPVRPEQLSLVSNGRH